MELRKRLREGTLRVHGIDAKSVGGGHGRAGGRASAVALAGDGGLGGVGEDIVRGVIGDVHGVVAVEDMAVEGKMGRRVLVGWVAGGEGEGVVEGEGGLCRTLNLGPRRFRVDRANVFLGHVEKIG